MSCGISSSYQAVHTSLYKHCACIPGDAANIALVLLVECWWGAWELKLVHNHQGSCSMRAHSGSMRQWMAKDCQPERNGPQFNHVFAGGKKPVLQGVENNQYPLLQSQSQSTVTGCSYAVQLQSACWPQVDAISEALMPSGVRGLRSMFHATAVEVLLYLTPVHCQDMLDSLTTSLNATFTSFMKRNPAFQVCLSPPHPPTHAHPSC